MIVSSDNNSVDNKRRNGLFSHDIYNHYQKVKKLIQSKSEDGEMWRAGVGDFCGWYREAEDGLRLCCLNDDLDYVYLTKNYRTLYWTLNYFSLVVKEGRRPYEDRENKTVKIGSRATTRAYSIGLDIDSIGDIHQPEVKLAVEDAAIFFVNKLKPLVPNSLHVLFSGGGIYILIHHKNYESRSNNKKIEKRKRD